MENSESQTNAKRSNDEHSVNESVSVKIVLAALVLVALFLAIVNSLLNPLFEPPDELQHYQFVQNLVAEKALPVQRAGETISQAHQPPLYYVVGALLAAPVTDAGDIPERNAHWTSYSPGTVHRDNKNQFLPGEAFAFPYRGTALAAHILRFWSILLMAGTLIVAWQLGKELWPAEPWKRLLQLAVIALLPMYLYIGSSINNDNLVIFLGALLLLLTARGLKNNYSWRTTILIGLVWGLAILSKLSGLMLLVPWLIGLIWLSVWQKDWRLLASRSVVIGAIALAISGWWFARNYRLYGELFGLEQMLDIWGERTVLDIGRFQLGGTLSYLWTNFWGRFGYGQVVMPRAVYWLFTALAIAGLAGLIWLVVRTIRDKRLGQVRAIWWIFGATCGAYLAALVYYMSRSPTGANSRYVFPALPAFAALLVAGLAVYASSRRAAIALIALLGGLAIFSVGLFVPWTYAAPRKLSVESAMVQAPTAQQLIWGDAIRLLGTKVEPNGLTVEPGAEVTVSACWLAEAKLDRNYTLFVHILDPALNSLGQRNMHPGLGNLPTSVWQPGDIFCDRYRVPITAAEPAAPLLAMVEIGFVDGQAKKIVPAQTLSGQDIDFTVVEQLVVRPSTPAVQPEPDVQLAATDFAQDLALLGYTLAADSVLPNDEFVVRLWWAAGGPLDDNYQVFAHLVGENGQLITQADGPPQEGVFPTAYWEKGDTIIDERRFYIPQDAPEGQTTLRLGFYRLSDGGRLSRSPGAPLPDSVEIPGPTIGQ